MLSSLATVDQFSTPNSLLVGRGAIGRHVHHERSSSTIIKEVDRNTHWATIVCRKECTGEVWQKVDLSPVIGTLCEDTWDSNADVWLGI